MQWSWAGSAAVILSLLALGSPVTRGAGLVGLGLCAVIAVWRSAWCRHPGPLGLLPPVTNPDGTRSSAHWFCDRCGKTWAASFEREHTPILKFDGYDQSKAPDAARRANELERRQRTLALRRAGLTPQRRRSDREAEVVPMLQLRQVK
jgi:hypothetical protein